MKPEHSQEASAPLHTFSPMSIQEFSRGPPWNKNMNNYTHSNQINPTRQHTSENGDLNPDAAEPPNVSVCQAVVHSTHQQPDLISLAIHGIPLIPSCPVANMLGTEQLGHIAWARGKSKRVKCLGTSGLWGERQWEGITKVGKSCYQR